MNQLLKFTLCPAFATPLLILQSVYGQEKAPTERIVPGPAVASVTSGQYRQQVRTNFGPNEGLPEGAVHNVTFDQKLYAATEKGIASFDNGQWKLIHATKAPVKVLAASRNKVWFTSDNQVFELVDAANSKSVATPPAGTTITALLATEDTLLIGTTKGLFTLDAGAMVDVRPVNQLLHDHLDIRQIAAYQGEIAVAAAGGLISYNQKSKQAAVLTPRNRHIGWALHDVRGVGFDSTGNLWFAALQGVGHRNGSGWNLYTGYEGLPYNDFTCLTTGTGNDVWFGTRKGAIHFTGRQWEYRQGKRWLGDDVVNSIAVTPTGDAWFATPAGVTRIESRPMSLREKAAFFNSEIDRYHRRTPFGYVDGIHLQKPGDKSTGTQYDSDNDGLWTSMYGAGECFEYAVTRSPESKKRADNAFRAVAFLSEVPQGGKQSPPFGFPARTILPTSGRNPNDNDNAENDQRHQRNDPQWKVISPRWPVSADGKWYWKTDTSSDELDGHYFFYALYYDLVADTDQEKKDVRAVVDRVTTHLIEHDFSLIDHDGKPTRWGRFSPSDLNTDVLSDCRGLNSISILSYLLAADHITGDKKYREKYNELLHQHNYFTNVLNGKHQNGPGSGNQSDDEMAFMCYYNLFTYEKDPKLRRQYMRSFARYFAQEEPEACPLFSLIYAAFYAPVRAQGRPAPVSIIEDSVETLQRFPLDRINWGYENSHRLDIVPLSPHIPEYRGRGHLRSGKVIPIDEQFVNHWNHDPWRLDGRGSGQEMADGASFLLPYWLGVYQGLIKEQN